MHASYIQIIKIISAKIIIIADNTLQDKTLSTYIRATKKIMKWILVNFEHVDQ